MSTSKPWAEKTLDERQESLFDDVAAAVSDLETASKDVTVCLEFLEETVERWQNFVNSGGKIDGMGGHQ